MAMFKIISFNLVISEEDWEILIEVLSQEDNKVFGLDFSRANLRSYFKKFLEVMRTDNLYLYVDQIIFGKVNLSTRKMIKLANFLLIYYSETENPMPTSMMSYVLKCDDNYQCSRILELKRNQIRKSSVNHKIHAGAPFGVKYNRDNHSKNANNARDFSRNKEIPVANSVSDIENSIVDDPRKERVLKIDMKLQRNLSVFDYKILYAIHKQCAVQMDIDIVGNYYKEPKKFNPNICFSEIRAVIQAMDYYMEPEDQRFINFRLMIFFSYINFFIILIACLTIPPIHKENCGSGISWNGHFIMWALCILSIFVEIFLFY